MEEIAENKKESTRTSKECRVTNVTSRPGGKRVYAVAPVVGINGLWESVDECKLDLKGKNFEVIEMVAILYNSTSSYWAPGIAVGASKGPLGIFVVTTRDFFEGDVLGIYKGEDFFLHEVDWGEYTVNECEEDTFELNRLVE